MATGYYHSPDLPWTISEEEQERFRKILKRVAIVFLVCAIVVPILPTPKMEREVVEEVPPRLAKLLLERQQPKPPAAPEAPQPEGPKSKPKPKEVKPKEIKPKEVKKDVAAARKKAERSGLLAFKDELADLRVNPAADNVRNNKRLTQGVGTTARRSERSLITSNATTGSGGINTAALSRDTGGGGLAGRGTTAVASPVNSGGGGSVRRGGGNKAARSIEEIQLVFDRNKSAIYALYNRVLRRDPSLQGKVVLKITIAPSGQVTACQLVSSELHHDDLERKLVARIRQFDFGAKDVDTMVVTYPIDFLPS